MAGASHDPVFAKKVGVPMKTAKEFNKADTRSKFLKSAMRAKGPAYAEGGEISPAQRSQDFLDRLDEDRARESAKKEETARTRKPRSDRRNPDRATITKGIPMPPPPPPPPPAPPVSKYAQGGALPRPPGTTDTQYQAMLNANPTRVGTAGNNPTLGATSGRPGGEISAAHLQRFGNKANYDAHIRSLHAAHKAPPAAPMQTPAQRSAEQQKVMQQAAQQVAAAKARQMQRGQNRVTPAMAEGGTVSKYARGGSVRGSGCETKGLKKATIY